MKDQYEADFSEARARGIGVRFKNKPTGRYLDLRLVEPSFREFDQTKKSRGIEFKAGDGVSISYEADQNSVKETIILNRRDLNEFKFALKAPKLTPRNLGSSIIVGNSLHPALFMIKPPVAWDARGTDLKASMELNGAEVVVRLDRQQVELASLPITVDPMIEGTNTELAFSRKLFQLEDGRLIFFYGAEAGAGSYRLAYQVSSDNGRTWGAVQDIGPASYGSSPSVVQTAGDRFYLAYVRNDFDSSWVSVRALVPDGTGSWSIGAAVKVYEGEVFFWPHLSIVDLGEGVLGRRLAVGFFYISNAWPYLGATFAAAISEDSGSSWTPPFDCTQQDGGFGTLVSQPGRLICIYHATGGPLKWKQWLSGVWSPSQTLASSGSTPIGTTAPDGTIHLTWATAAVGEDSPILYSSLRQDESTWSPPQSLGLGAEPTISIVDGRLYVFAEERPPRVHGGLSFIRPYVSPDGVSWAALDPIQGGPFVRVLDENENWTFVDKPGDLLFSFSHAAGSLGNQIGTESYLHRLDALTKKVSFRFESQSSSEASGARLWYTAQASPIYRVGIQGDLNGHPNGEWLPSSEGLLARAYAETTFLDTGIPLDRLIAFPKANLGAGVSYHVVVEPVQDLVGLSNPSSQKWASFQTVGVAAGAEGSLGVLERDGSTWQEVGERIPRFSVLSGGDLLVEQRIAPSNPIKVDEYSIPSERFGVAQSISPSELSLYLGQLGSPTTELTIRILDSNQDELWSAQLSPSSPGWVSLGVSGVTFNPGNTYRLVLDSRVRDPNNKWTARISGDYFSSWEGNGSTLSLAVDRPGFNDRTAEALDQFTSDGIVAFNSGASDALYLGANAPFGLVSVATYSPEALSNLVWSYWNGDVWTTFTPSLQFDSFARYFAFPPPDDWFPSLIEGFNSYWIKLTLPSGTSELPINWIATFPNQSYPTTPPSAAGYIPLAFTAPSNSSGSRGVDFLPFLGGATDCVSCTAFRHPDADSYGSQNSSISADGRLVAFESDQGFFGGPTFLPPDAHPTEHTLIYLADRASRTIERIPPIQPQYPNGSSRNASISPDGTFIAFESDASNLDLCCAPDTNQATDIFLYDIVTKTIKRITNGYDSSRNPKVAAGGRYVAFESFAQLTSEDTNGVSDIYLYDSSLQTTTLVTG